VIPFIGGSMDPADPSGHAPLSHLEGVVPAVDPDVVFRRPLDFRDDVRKVDFDFAVVVGVDENRQIPEARNSVKTRIS
jgi:hypothetical protein